MSAIKLVRKLSPASNASLRKSLVVLPTYEQRFELFTLLQNKKFKVEMEIKHHTRVPLILQQRKLKMPHEQSPNKIAISELTTDQCSGGQELSPFSIGDLRIAIFYSSQAYPGGQKISSVGRINGVVVSATVTEKAGNEPHKGDAIFYTESVNFRSNGEFRVVWHHDYGSPLSAYIKILYAV